MNENSLLSTENTSQSSRADFIYTLIENRKRVQARARNLTDELKSTLNVTSIEDAKQLAITLFKYIASFIMFIMLVTENHKMLF